MNNKTFRNHISQQCGFNKTQPQRLLESIIPAKQEIRTALKSYLNPAFNEKLDRHLETKAIQVCNAGDWPDRLPSSFGDWLKSNNDAIDIGGNEIPDRIAANLDAYGNENLPF